MAMKNTQRIEKSFMLRAVLMLAMVSAAATLTACSPRDDDEPALCLSVVAAADVMSPFIGDAESGRFLEQRRNLTRRKECDQ